MEVFLLDVQEQFGVEGAEVDGDEGICAIRILFDRGGGEGAGVAD